MTDILTSPQSDTVAGFNEDRYLDANPDVASAVSSGTFQTGLEHYLKFGRGESRPMVRSNELDRKERALFAINRSGIGLEIGASFNPIAPKAAGFNVEVLDHLDAAGLRAKYASAVKFGACLENIEEVDYIWQGQSFVDLIGKRSHYDWIVASHVIEHVPDIVAFLRDCTTLLKPNGKLSLIIPDKRYEMDCFGDVTTTGAVLDSFLVKSTRPSPGKVFDHFANAVTLGGKVAWSRGSLGDYQLIHSFIEASSAWARASQSSEYIDVHAWRFVPESFELIISDLAALGLIDLGIIVSFGTVGSEFHVTLEKDHVSSPNHRLSYLKSAVGIIPSK